LEGGLHIVSAVGTAHLVLFVPNSVYANLVHIIGQGSMYRMSARYLKVRVYANPFSTVYS